MAEKAFFDSGQAALKDEGQGVLGKLGEALKKYPTLGQGFSYRLEDGALTGWADPEFEHDLLGSNGWQRSDIEAMLELASSGALVPVAEAGESPVLRIADARPQPAAE